MIQKLSEFDFIRWAQKQLPPDATVLLPSGDDTALLKTTAKTAFTTDALVDKIHFDLHTHRPGDIGAKAINVNVSDIAAMGMQPSHCVITFCVPENLPPQKLKAIFSGMVRACIASKLSIVGGDFTRSPGPLMINVAMIGKTFAQKGPQNALLTRSGAKAGHALFVTGVLGGSITGKHLRFTPRLSEVQHLLGWGRPSSMIDISDGLSSELHHICRNSAVGAQLFQENIPTSASARKNNTPLQALNHALNDGEDFELLFTTPPALTQKIKQQWDHPTPISQIGIICEQKKGVTLIDKNNNTRMLSSGGWVH